MSQKKNESCSHQHEGLMCRLCMKEYQEPRLLNCLHSFCLECLSTYVKSKNWKKSLLCPLCQKEMLIPKGGLENISEDFYIRAKKNVDKLKMTSECQKCTEVNFAKSRCLECDINLCETCKASHIESDSEKLHHFLEFVEGVIDPSAKSLMPTQLTQASYCSKHTSEELKVYCRKCNLSICIKCKESLHADHPIQNSRDVAKVMRDTLSPLVLSVKEYLPEFHEYAKKISERQRELYRDVENTIKDIQSRSRFLQKEIEKISRKLISEVKERHKAGTEKLDQEVKQVDKAYQSLSSIVQSAERMVKYGSDKDILDSSRRIQKRFLQIEDEIPHSVEEKVETVGFIPGGLKADTLPVMFGQCIKGELDLPTLPIPWSLRVVKEFEIRPLSTFRCKQTPETIHAIAPVSADNAWICCGWGSKEISLFTSAGEILKKVELDIQIDHICMTYKGDLLISSYEDQYIKKLDRDYNVSDFAMPHLFPGGMTMTKRKELFVCAVDSYTTRRQPHSKRVLMKMTEYGFNVDEVDEYKDEFIFGAPYRVAENCNRDLCVTDREDGKLKVTVVDQEGEIKSQYKGPTGVKMKQGFNPLGVCCDRYSNILVSDWGNHCVHMLDSDCQFLGFILSKKDGLYKPNAMAVDTAGNLWVGDGNSTVRVYNYVQREH